MNRQAVPFGGVAHGLSGTFPIVCSNGVAAQLSSLLFRPALTNFPIDWGSDRY